MEKTMECWFKHTTEPAHMKIFATSAEAAGEQAKKLLANRSEWTLVMVREKQKGMFGNILG